MFTRAWIRDATERVTATAIEAGAAAVVVDLADGSFDNGWQAIAIAAAGAAASMIKALIAARWDGTMSPASLAR